MLTGDSTKLADPGRGTYRSKKNMAMPHGYRSATREPRQLEKDLRTGEIREMAMSLGRANPDYFNLQFMVDVETSIKKVGDVTVDDTHELDTINRLSDAYRKLQK